MTRNEDDHRCTLTAAAAWDRIEADRALVALVVGTERLPQGLRVAFAGGPGTRALVDTFVEHERGCCGFFEFAVDRTDDAVVLELTAPDAAQAQTLVDAAQRTFELGADQLEPMMARRLLDG